MPEGEESRVIKVNTVKDGYLEVNHIIDEAIKRLKSINKCARESEILSEEGVVEVIRHNLGIIKELESNIFIEL